MVKKDLVYKTPSFIVFNYYWRKKIKHIFRKSKIIMFPTLIDWAMLRIKSNKYNNKDICWAEKYFERGWKIDKVLRYKKGENVILLWGEIIERVEYFLKEVKPDFIITEGIQSLPCYAVFLCATRNKIPYIQLSGSRVGEGMEMYNDLSIVPFGFSTSKPLSKESLSKAKDYIRRIKSQRYEAPYYVKKNIVNISKFKHTDIEKTLNYLIEKIEGGILEPTARNVLHPFISKLKAFRISRMLKNRKYYKALEDIKKYKSYKKMLFPLHVTPEASTDLWAPKYNDMYKTAKNISENLPQGWILIIKEHPSAVSLIRDFSEIKRISKLPRAILVNPHIANDRLYELCDLGIVVNGTMGMEMIIKRFPVITLANPIYDITKNTVPCFNLQELSQAIEKALEKEIDESKNIEFIAAYYESTMEGIPINPDFWPETLKDNNISLIANSLKKIFEQKERLIEEIDKEKLTVI